MFGRTFDHKIVSKAISAFGTLFNDISIIRTNSAGSAVEYIKIPIEYGEKQGWFVELLRPHTEVDSFSIIYPRMGYAISGFRYDSARKLTTMTRMNYQSSDTEELGIYNPVPWIVSMNLYVAAKNYQDLFQVLGNILPFFTPSFTLKSSSIPDLGLTDDIKFVLNSVNYEKEFNDRFAAKNLMVLDLSFDVKIMFYGPIDYDSIIRKVQIDLYVPPGDQPVSDIEVATTPRSVRVTTVPDPLEAQPGDEYSSTSAIQDFTDNKKYNPETGLDEPVVGSIECRAWVDCPIVCTVYAPTITSS